MELKPRIGVGDLKLGMSAEEIVAVMGEPRLKRKTTRGEDEFFYYDNNDINVVIGSSGSGIVHIGINSSVSLSYHDKNIFSHPSLWLELIAEDGNPYEHLGFIVLLSLQITLTGFHDNDTSQKAITVFTKGTWDRFLPKLKPFNFESRGHII